MALRAAGESATDYIYGLYERLLAPFVASLPAAPGPLLCCTLRNGKELDAVGRIVGGGEDSSSDEEYEVDPQEMRPSSPGGTEAAAGASRPGSRLLGLVSPWISGTRDYGRSLVTSAVRRGAASAPVRAALQVGPAVASSPPRRGPTFQL